MGKTAVFVLATLQQLEPVDGQVNFIQSNIFLFHEHFLLRSLQVSVIVLCHTRELAFQISREYERFCRYMPSVRVAKFFGGIPIQNDEELLKNQCPHIVVGTPGRVLALARSKALVLRHIKHFIVDECDKVLESLGKTMKISSFVHSMDCRCS